MKMRFSKKYHKALWGRIAKMEIETQELKKQVNQIKGVATMPSYAPTTHERG